MEFVESRDYERNILNSIQDTSVRRIVELLFLYAEDGLYEVDLEELQNLIKDK